MVKRLCGGPVRAICRSSRTPSQSEVPERGARTDFDILEIGPALTSGFPILVAGNVLKFIFGRMISATDQSLGTRQHGRSEAFHRMIYPFHLEVSRGRNNPAAYDPC